MSSDLVLVSLCDYEEYPCVGIDEIPEGEPVYGLAAKVPADLLAAVKAAWKAAAEAELAVGEWLVTNEPNVAEELRWVQERMR